MKLKKQLYIPEKIETFTTQDSEDIQYLIEIHDLPSTYEAWIYRNDCGVKNLMFGISKDNIKKQEFIELVNGQLDEYANQYYEEYL